MRNTFRMLFYTRAGKVKKSGKQTIFIRITIRGEKCSFSTNIDIAPTLWSSKEQKATGLSDEAIQTNRLLDYYRAKASSIYQQHIVSSVIPSIYTLRDELQGEAPCKKPKLLEMFLDYNMKKMKCVGISLTQSSYNKYDLTYRRLKAFVGLEYRQSDLCLSKINLTFIMRFEAYLKVEHGLSHNSSVKLLKIFKHIMLVAHEDGLTESNPFVHYKFRSTPTYRSFLTEHELILLTQQKFESKRLERVRDFYLFCCWTGLSYCDVSNLKKENIVKGVDGESWIIMERSKTLVEAHIKLLPLPKRILEKYEDKSSEYALPIISNSNFNKYLKEIAFLCGINKRMTVHTARHTFSTTVGILNGLPIETLSRMLGHTNIKTTQIYAKILDSKISEDVNLLSDRTLNLQNLYS